MKNKQSLYKWLYETYENDLFSYGIAFGIIEVNSFELIDEEKERAAMQKQLKKMLDSLTDRQREAVYLRYTQGLSYEEIGKLMGIQPKAAQKLVYRAIEQMRKIQPQIIYFFLFGYFL